MSGEYDHGRRDGLRMALAILAAEEEKWAALLGRSRSGKTNAIRAIRHKTLRIAQGRIRTALNRLRSRGGAVADDELAAALDRAGL